MASVQLQPHLRARQLHGTPLFARAIQVWNPAFDVTPAKLITDVITDHGCIPKAG